MQATKAYIHKLAYADNRESYMSGYALLNLLNELGNRDFFISLETSLISSILQGHEY